MKTLLLATLILFGFCFYGHASNHELPQCAPFGLLTIPKTGTHLIMKCLGMIQKRTNLCLRQQLGLRNFNQSNYDKHLEEYLSLIESLIDDQHYFDDHSHVCKIIGHFMDRHPHFPWIIGVRDIRDTLISQAYFIWDKLESVLGPTTLQQKITFLLDIKKSSRDMIPTTPIMYLQAKNVLAISDKKNALIIRFEDLVGSKGGGNDVIQRQTIKNIASHIGVPVSESQLDYIQENLFGTEVRVETMKEETFRSGKIGSWKEVFTPDHLKYFRKHYGKFQKAFGYPVE